MKFPSLRGGDKQGDKPLEGETPEQPAEDKSKSSKPEKRSRGKLKGQSLQTLQVGKAPPVTSLVPLVGTKVAVPTWEAIDKYKDIYYVVREPYQYVNLRLEEGELLYSNVEPQLNEDQEKILKRVAEAYDMLINVGTILSTTEDKSQFLSETFREILKLYNIKLSDLEYLNLLYHIERDFVGYGKIDTLVRDRLIEDISCNGPGLPVYVYHRLFESIRTNVVFEEVELNSFILRLAQISGRHISILQPIRDAALPDGSRINMTLGKEVTKKGSTFTIRKFRSDPISPVEIMLLRTANSRMFAWLWVLVEFGRSLLISGGTAAGKSVPYQEKVWVYRSGRPSLVSIGSLYDEMAKSNPSRREGERNQYEVVDCEGMETAAFGPDLKVGRFKVKSVVRHPADEYVYRVTTRSGRVVHTTADHSLFTMAGGWVEPYPVSMLMPEMFVAVPRRMPEPSDYPRPLNLPEPLSMEDYGTCVGNVAGYAKRSAEPIGREETARLLGTQQRSDWHSDWSQSITEGIGRQTLLSYLEDTGTKGQTREKLVTLAHSDIFWDEVESVERVKYDGKYVYDLEVPGAQNFVGGEKGLFLHNTTLLNAVSMLIKPENKIVSVEDSVTRDAEILIKENDNIRKVLIGDFVDDALRAGTEMTEAGHELARKGGLKVLTCDASGKSVWSPCTAVIRHRVNKEFVQVTTNSGRRIMVTADHSLFSLSDDGIVSKVLAGDLVLGSFVVAPGSYPQEKATHQFELDKLPAFSEFVFKAPEVNNNGEGVLLELKSGVYAKHSPLSIPSSLTVDEDLAFLAGLWLADGFYGDRTIGFSVEAKRLGPRLEQIAKKLGVNLTRHSDGVSLLMNSKPLRRFFETVLGLSGDDYSRHIPDLFFGVNERVLAFLIRGYFTGDGSASASEIEIDSASRTLLCDLQTLLLRFGLILNIGTKRKIGSLGGIGVYRARIVGASQVARFRDLIGFEGDTKTTKILPERKISKYSLDPIPLNEPLENEIKGQLGGITQTALGERLRNGLKSHVVLRQTLLQLGHLKPAYQRSKGYELALSGFYFDRVVSVEKERREEMVYDLSVPETGRFIANNILCHNTPEINLAHPNWIQAVTRVGFGETVSGISGISGISGVSGVSVGGRSAGDISLFDLLISSLRQRPEFIIVGEVRGEEAYTLFQAISVGHATLGTIHAASMPELLARVESQPMNVPRVMLANLDVVIFLAAVRKGEEKVRRVREVVEILGIDPTTKELVTNTVFRWDPVKDEFSFSGRSFQIEKLSKSSGIPIETLQREIDNRVTLLERMREQGITNYRAVTDVVRRYYVDKEQVMAAPKLVTTGPISSTNEMSWTNGEEA